ncbi:MAG: hypothetical protein HYX80_06525 [Chloroflexi bacterium]|nr:hypothetical protein [Chloroflexota bacterium]
MEWLLFTYWLPPEPSRKRVFIWRQLKKVGALSVEGTGWLLPKTEPLIDAITGIMRSVEELEGTANLYTLTHFSEAQEQRNIGRFREEREREYSGIIGECHKALKHIERETHMKEFNFQEIEELEGDLEKIKRWFADVKKRDFWQVPAQREAENLISQVETTLAGFVQKTYEEQERAGEGKGARPRK